jgi:hypothetical protein
VNRVYRFMTEDERDDVIRCVKPWESPFEEAEPNEEEAPRPLDFNEDGGFERGYN